MVDIIVEDGTGVAYANSYITVSGVGAYSNIVGYDAWNDIGLTTIIKEQALMRATRYINNLPWKGRRSVQDQPLAWPRIDLYDDDDRLVPSNSIPQNVIDSVCEAAVLCLPDSTIELEPILTKDDYITKEQVTGTVAVAYVVNNQSLRSRSTVIESKLRGYLRNKITVELIRN